MTEDEDRHADEVNIAFQMGAEWQKKQSDSAWKGIHYGAVRALQARINELEGLVKELLRSNWDNSWPTMRKYETFEEYENAVLGEKND
jgi:hypothetical protein